MDERIEQWIKNNPAIFGKIIAVVVFVFGVCLIIGADPCNDVGDNAHSDIAECHRPMHSGNKKEKA